jgi:D-alanine-D-alanine ligase
MKVAIVYNQPEPGKVDSEDILAQVDFVRSSLLALGHGFQTFAISTGSFFSPPDDASFYTLRGKDRGLDFFKSLHLYSPDIVFNLFEGWEGDPRLHSLPSAIFQFSGYPYTGSNFDALFLSTDKKLAKAVLKSNGIPVPGGYEFRGTAQNHSMDVTNPPWIVKPAWQDASVGIEDGSVYYDADLLSKDLPAIFKKFDSQPLLIEEYIEGREFNISLLEGADGKVEILPAAEQVFRDWPEGKPRIINYSAKWDKDSFEYQNTVRKFNYTDAPLDSIRDAALRCWDAFHLRGYARVDMRVDAKGGVYVIEINANPCIAADSGFVAAALEAGYEPKDIIKKIMEAALR